MMLRKPMFNAVVDLGLRDVGVSNDPRRLALLFAKLVVGAAVLALLLVVVACLAQGRIGAATVATWALGCTVWAALQMFKGLPVVVWRVDASGTNRVTWLPIPTLILSIPLVVIHPGPGTISLVALSGLGALVVFSRRDKVPELLHAISSKLATDEAVLGDGIGLVRTSRRDPARLIVCTDRRVLVDSTKAPVLDTPYASLTRFGVTWSMLGRSGTLSLTAGTETHVIGGMAPLNLLSIARALQSNGVPPDDPAVIADAEQAWAEAQRPRRRWSPQLGALRTRGLWLTLGAFAVLFHLRPLGMSAAMLPLFAMVCLGCGHLDAGRTPVAHVVGLVIVALPAFAVMDPVLVIVLMIVFAAVAGVCVAAGAALRRARDPGTADVPRSLLGVALGAAGGLLAVGGIFGFDPAMVRLAMAQAGAGQLRVDGRSDLAGRAATLTYTPGPDLRELVKDEGYDAGPNDGARWEVRSPFRQGDNVVSLTHYIFDRPPLSTPAAVAAFVAGKDAEHAALAGVPVAHTERVIDGRTGYVWTHRDPRGYWYHVVWLPHPVHTIRLECIAREQVQRFQRLCAEATASLKLH